MPEFSESERERERDLRGVSGGFLRGGFPETDAAESSSGLLDRLEGSGGVDLRPRNHGVRGSSSPQCGFRVKHILGVGSSGIGNVMYNSVHHIRAEP